MFRTVSCPVVWAAFLAGATCAWGAPPGVDQADPPSIILTAYPDGPNRAEPGDIRVTTPAGPLKVVGVEAVDPARPLLIILDPGSTPRRQAQKFLSAVAAHPGLRRSAIPVRLGIAVLDGILLDPIADPERLAAEFERTLQGYFPEPMQPGTSGAGRFFDLVAGLIAATQARQGDLDCLILGPDRFLEDEESAYLIEGLERKLLSVTLGAGTTVYGYLQGAGLWGDLCAASGGLSFDFPAPPSSVIDRLLARRGRGLRIRAELPPTGLLPGRHTVRMGMPDPGESGRPWAGPRSFWAGGDRGDPPDYYMMRQALDWKRRSREAEQEGNLTVALRSMENSLQEDPWNRDSYCEAGRLAAASGDLVQASGFLSRAMEHVELDERTLALYSSVYERRGMAAAALEAIRSRGGAQDRLSRLFSARLLAGLDRYEEARALYAELMASELPDDRLRGEYGRVIWALGEHAAAEEQFEAAVRKNPHDLPALVGLSEAALARGDLERAADRAERALREGPNDPDARAQTARVFRARADLPAARSALSRAVDLAPHRHDILALLADVELEAGRSEEANRLLVGALADYPDSPRIYRKLSELRLRTGDIASAAAVLEAGASRTGTQTHELYREAARRRERRGEFGQALLNYRAMLESAPPEQADALGRSMKDHLTYLSLLTGGNIESFQPATAPPAAPAAPGPEEAGPADRAAAVKAAALRDLLVPGGIELLARAAGVDASRLEGPEALTRLFSFILGTSPAHSRKLEDHPVRREVVTHLRNYRALMRHLADKGILPDPDRPGEARLLAFPLAGSKAGEEAAKQFLGFFGVNYKLRRPRDGAAEIRIVLKEGRKHEDRQRLLHHMGINLLGEPAREVRVSLRDSRLPLPIEAAVWRDKVLGKQDVREDELLEQMVLDLDAMRLHVALAECAEETRDALIEASAPGELLQDVEILRLFARFLDVRGGHLEFPGSARSWKRFLGASDGDQEAAILGRLLRQDRGRALALYFLLSIAPESVREHFSSSPQTLAALYSPLPPIASGYSSRSGVGAYWDLSRLMGLMGADGRGAYLNLDPRLRAYIPGLPPEEPGTGETRIRLDVPGLASLVQFLAEPDPGAPFTPIEVLEFLAHAQAENPELLDEPALSGILTDPPAVPVFLDLVWSLRLPSELAARYLDYCRSTALARDKGWNVNRTRTSQALFYLIGLIHSQGVLTRDEGRSLLDRLLTDLAHNDEAAFAGRVAAFISLRLVPLLQAGIPGEEDASEVLWKALAGSTAGLAIRHDGATAEGDVAAFKLARMKAAVLQQEYAPLSDLLELLGLLGELSAGPPAGTERLERFAKRFAHLRQPKPQPAIEKAIQRKAALADVAGLTRSWDELASRRAPDPSIRLRLVRETAAVLHLELGVTLLTFCYAFEGSPETDPLVFDPFFVRRHAFYWNAKTTKGTWSAAQVESKDDLGTFVVGSLSGLGGQLSRLETAQMARGFGTGEDLTMLPTLLSGMRSLARTLRSDRAQAFVALTTRLGREVVTMSSADPGWLRWCEGQLGELLLPKRRNRILRELRSGDPIPALRSLAPSELFLLGNAYLGGRRETQRAAGSSDSAASNGERGLPVSGLQEIATGDPVPAMSCPLLDELDEIPAGSGPADARLFAEEVRQYGVPLRRRMGLGQSSLLPVRNSYEQLDGWHRDGLLFERICDLKFQLAELGYSLGWPAALGELLAEVTLQDVRPGPGEVETNSWRPTLERIAGLSHAHARQWVEECLNRGYLVKAGSERASDEAHERPAPPEEMRKDSPRSHGT